MTDEEKMLSKGYNEINLELNGLINNQSLIQRYLWYSMGEIILQSEHGINVNFAADICGSMMTLLIGSNSECRDIIYNVRNRNTDYEETLKRMQISENIQDVGDEWKEILKCGDIDTLVNMSNILKKYSADFLPCVKYYFEFWCKNYHENFNKQTIDKIIKNKSNAIKQFTNVIDGYIEIIKL